MPETEVWPMDNCCFQLLLTSIRCLRLGSEKEVRLKRRKLVRGYAVETWSQWSDWEFQTVQEACVGQGYQEHGEQGIQFPNGADGSGKGNGLYGRGSAHQLRRQSIRREQAWWWWDCELCQGRVQPLAPCLREAALCHENIARCLMGQKGHQFLFSGKLGPCCLGGQRGAWYWESGLACMALALERKERQPLDWNFCYNRYLF